MNNNILRVQNLLYDDIDDIDSHAHNKNSLDNQDIGMINQVSGAGIKSDKEGNLEMASGQNLGIYINKANKEIVLIGDSVRIISKEFNVGRIPYHYIRQQEEEVMSIMKRGGQYDD